MLGRPVISAKAVDGPNPPHRSSLPPATIPAINIVLRLIFMASLFYCASSKNSNAKKRRTRSCAKEYQSDLAQLCVFAFQAHCKSACPGQNPPARIPSGTPTALPHPYPHLRVGSLSITGTRIPALKSAGTTLFSADVSGVRTIVGKDEAAPWAFRTEFARVDFDRCTPTCNVL